MVAECGPNRDRVVRIWSAISTPSPTRPRIQVVIALETVLGLGRKNQVGTVHSHLPRMSRPTHRWPVNQRMRRTILPTWCATRPHLVYAPPRPRPGPALGPLGRLRAPPARENASPRGHPRESRDLSVERERAGAPVARCVEREIRAYLDCGILARGFLRLHCDSCGRDRLLAFSCKGRALCPSCGGRRMADSAAYLVDRVLPEVPVRQWVLTLPYPLRYRCAWDSNLTSEVLGAFMRSLFADQRRRARFHHGVQRAQCGSVAAIQRFGSALNLAPHLHSLVLDGVYGGPPHAPSPFFPLPPPSTEDVTRVMASDQREPRLTRPCVRSPRRCRILRSPCWRFRGTRNGPAGARIPRIRGG